jgi:hypothetical protein
MASHGEQVANRSRTKGLSEYSNRPLFIGRDFAVGGARTRYTPSVTTVSASDRIQGASARLLEANGARVVPQQAEHGAEEEGGDASFGISRGSARSRADYSFLISARSTAACHTVSLPSAASPLMSLDRLLR